jgi:hypothetical protein
MTGFGQGQDLLSCGGARKPGRGTLDDRIKRGEPAFFICDLAGTAHGALLYFERMLQRWIKKEKVRKERH